MCCCGVPAWIRVIGFAQIALHTISLGLIMAEIWATTTMAPDDDDAIDHEFWPQRASSSNKALNIFLRFVLPVTINMVGLGMGVLMSLRSHKKDRETTYLRYLSAYAIVLLFWFVLARYNLPKNSLSFFSVNSMEDSSGEKLAYGVN